MSRRHWMTDHAPGRNGQGARVQDAERIAGESFDLFEHGTQALSRCERDTLAALMAGAIAAAAYGLAAALGVA